MSIIPWIEGPFDSMFRGFNDNQDNFECIKFELNAANCLEAYGKHHVNKKCIDYMDDLRECAYRFKQNMRVKIMRMERLRQYKAGERSAENRYAQAPEPDAF